MACHTAVYKKKTLVEKSDVMSDFNNNRDCLGHFPLSCRTFCMSQLCISLCRMSDVLLVGKDVGHGAQIMVHVRTFCDFS